MGKAGELQNFIAETESLLGDLTVLETAGQDSQSETDAEVHEQVRKRSLELISSEVEQRLDGCFEISIDEDDLRAVATFHPPRGGGVQIQVKDVIETLAKEGVTSGINFAAARQAVFRCNAERIPLENIVVAHALMPVPEQPEHLQVDEQLVDAMEARTASHQRARLVLVKKGQVLAHPVPEAPGTLGCSVRGEMIPFAGGTVKSLEAGGNTSVDGRGLVASCAGRLNYDGIAMSVSPVLDITGNVGIKTGNVNFLGDVIVRGIVEDGYSVVSGGRIYCMESLHASEVSCEEDLIVRQGIIGRGSGSVKAGGRITAKFIEKCHVEAAGDIVVETYIVNSAVNTTGKLRVGASGFVVGGRVRAQQGIVANQIGTASGQKTELYCGTDFQVEQKLMLIRDRNIEIAVKLSAIEQRLKTAREGSQASTDLMGLRTRMKEAMHRLNESASRLVFQLDKSENAEVVVGGKVFPGTYIEICHVPYVADRTISKVRFHLSKINGKVAAEQLSAPHSRTHQTRENA